MLNTVIKIRASKRGEASLDKFLPLSLIGLCIINAFIESFNGSFRDECLNVNWFLSLDDAREKIES